MKILLVTGLLAEKTIREVVREVDTKHSIDVIVLPVQVVSLLSTRQIADYLKKMRISKEQYDLIIIPGLCPGSTEIIESEIGVPCYKGTTHAYDLSILLRLNNLHGVLNRNKPADTLVEKYILENNLKTLVKIQREAKTRGVRIGKLNIPIEPPPFIILSEITSTHTVTERTLLEKTSDLINKDADVIVLGFEPLNPHPDRVYNYVKLVKKEYDIPVAIDTLIPSEIKKGIEAGVDIVLSIDYCNVEEVVNYIGETLPVVIPYDSCRNYLPDTGLRTDFIDKIVEKISNKVENYILDPVLDPPVVGNLFESLVNYKVLRKKYVSRPLLMGVSNVIELIDSDSIGLNMLLTILALEVKASLLLVVEASSKTINSTRELVIASEMVTLAHVRNTPPKDLGLDLLFVKDKRRYDFKLDTENAEEIYVENYEYREKTELNEYFKIRIDYDNRVIETLYVSKDKKLLIKSKNIEDLKNYILSKRLVSSIPHALYLGIELGKAGEALVINKNYIQDQPLFREKMSLKQYLRREKGLRK